jgi:hypothetical protein
MSLGKLCENLESIHVHETEDEICHKAVQTALPSFLMNLFSANISPSTLGPVFQFSHIL